MILICLWMQHLAYSQKDRPIIVRGDSMIITSYVQVLRTEKDFGIDEARTRDSEFTRFTDKSIVFQGWDSYLYWFRIIINNPEPRERTFYLHMGHNSHDQSLLYQRKDTGWTNIGHGGTRYRFKDQTFPYVHHVMPVTIAANTTDTFYLKYNYNFNFKTFVFSLLSPSFFRSISYKLYFEFGFLVGILTLFFALNLYLYFSLRDRLHLWYAAYLIMVSFLILKYEGFERQFFGMDTLNATLFTPIQAIAAFCLYLQLHVIQIFLKNIKKDEWIYKVTSLVKFNLLISGIVHLILFSMRLGPGIESFIFQWSNKSLTLTIFTILVYCIVSYRRGSREAAMVFLGIIVFLVGGMEKLFLLESVSYAFPPSLFQAGLIIEAAILSFALMYNYNSLKKEKEQLLAELNRQNNLAAQNILIAQEAERKRIAEDLHDEIGSRLAVLKIRMQNMKIEEADLTELFSIVDEASTNTRSISHNLMPPEFEKTRLPDILQGYYNRLNKETNTRFLFISSGYRQHFPKTTELIIYRIIIEITKNILKHSGASEATVQLIFDQDGLEIMAEDDGMGIIKKDSAGIGMKNISSRVKYINGDMRIDTGKHGTTIIIDVPYNY